MKKRIILIVSVLLAFCLLLSGCGLDTIDPLGAETSQTTSSITSNISPDSSEEDKSSASSTPSSTTETTKPTQSDNKPVSLSSIPAYSGSPYVNINNGNPNFSKSDLTTKSYEYYSNVDNLGRCGVVHACIGRDIMPTEERGSIGMVKPTGWHTVKYDCVDGKYLYNRCHLIGFQLTGENANTKNLITGTRYMNVTGMLPFENMVADYVKETGNHVMYRVTPIFKGNNLLAHGVQMEAFSVEDDGYGICFNVFVYNVQPQITIDYATGESSYNGTVVEPDDDNDYETQSVSYILNKNTKKIHLPSCYSVKQMKESNKEYYTGDIDDLLGRGYSRCGNCNP